MQSAIVGYIRGVAEGIVLTRAILFCGPGRRDLCGPEILAESIRIIVEASTFGSVLF